MKEISVLSELSRLVVASLLIALGVLATSAARSHAAGSKDDAGAGFTVLGLSGKQDVIRAPGQIPSAFLVKGRYVEFTVVGSTLAIQKYTFTGAPSPLDMTGGRRTVVFASKTPDHRGLSLTGAMRIKLNGEALVLERTGPGLKMKIQAKDAPAGGIFQMEPERADGTATRFTHVLAGGTFYYDNPNFRSREGDALAFNGGTITVGPRVNIGSETAAGLVGRDSAQVASRVTQGCPTVIPAPRRPGGTQTVDHCGGVSVWSVASGGRMGGVFGEDATEVSPAATDCVADCQAQNQVRGRAAVLGFPFPAPAANRFQPRFPAGFTPPAAIAAVRVDARVPKVLGRSLRAARTSLRAAGLKVGRISYVRSAKPRGRVVRQSLRAGQRVKPGVRVNLVVSRGRK